MSNQVVITRPSAQAAPLAQRVASLGREVLVFPLLEIQPLPDPAPLQAALRDLRSYALVAFVSPNAIDAAFSYLQDWPREVAIAIVGEGSRQALARHGVTAANATVIAPRDPHRSDSQTLLEVLDTDALRARRVLIIRGETGRELLADALRAAGAEVTPVAAYRRSAPELDQARRVQLAGLLESPNDWIVTSSEALRILVRMVEQLADGAGVAKMLQQKIIVPHVRIAETAQMLGFRNITLTGSGDEQLLAALQFQA
jgi:uroporphyrinogen-III synthase